MVVPTVLARAALRTWRRCSGPPAVVVDSAAARGSRVIGTVPSPAARCCRYKPSRGASREDAVLVPYPEVTGATPRSRADGPAFNAPLSVASSPCAGAQAWLTERYKRGGPHVRPDPVGRCRG